MCNFSKGLLDLLFEIKIIKMVMDANDVEVLNFSNKVATGRLSSLRNLIIF
jgi:hypothetical protein